MKNLILILTILSFTLNSLASDVVLISPLAQIEERALPLELNKKYKSYSKYYLDSVPKSKNIENLLNIFENAQKYYLVKSFDLSRQYFERVIELSDVDEWKDVHRKIIFLSFLRMSELNKEQEEYWILQALRFSLEINPKKLNISKDTLRKVEKLKNSFLKDGIHWEVSQFKNDFNFILVNGHVIDLKKIEVVKIPSGKFRITFLSDVYKPQTYQVSSQQIPLLIPTRIPFVSGSCEKPFINNEGEVTSSVIVYYSKNCIKQLAGKNWKTIKEDVGQKKLTPEYSYSDNFSVSTSFDSEPIYKKTWFLTAAGVLGSILLYSFLKKDEKNPLMKL